MIYTSCFSMIKKIKEKNPTAIFVSIARYQPRWMKEKVSSEMVFAPSYDLFKKGREGIIVDKEFEREYKKQVGRSMEYVESVLKTWQEKKQDVILLCHEKLPDPEHFCHRTMLASLLKKRLGIRVEEWTDASKKEAGQETAQEETAQTEAVSRGRRLARRLSLIQGSLFDE